MSTKFPTLVYRCPGSHHIKGGSYDYLGVKTQEELDAALRDGYFATLPEAIRNKYETQRGHGLPATSGLPPLGATGGTASSVFVNKDGSTVESLGADKAPTREEMEEQAGKLGVKFTKKTTDEELLKKIDDALEA